MTAHDVRPAQEPSTPAPAIVRGNISDESSVKACIVSAREHHSPIPILIANARITEQKTHAKNIQGTFLAINYFFRWAQISQHQCALEIANPAIVVTGNETGKFRQAGHTEYVDGKVGLQYRLVQGVRNAIVWMNSRARINAVAPSWIKTSLMKGKLDHPGELLAEAQATVPFKGDRTTQDVVRAMVFLASHLAAGHISGECIRMAAAVEGRLLWRESEVLSSH